MTDKQLTPMQELIEWLTDSIILDNQDKDKCIDKATELLLKEKQVNSEFYINGAKDYCKSTYSIDTFINEYNNKFKTD